MKSIKEDITYYVDVFMGATERGGEIRLRPQTTQYLSLSLLSHETLSFFHLFYTPATYLFARFDDSVVWRNPWVQNNHRDLSKNIAKTTLIVYLVPRLIQHFHLSLSLSLTYAHFTIDSTIYTQLKLIPHTSIHTQIGTRGSRSRHCICICIHYIRLRSQKKRRCCLLAATIYIYKI